MGFLIGLYIYLELKDKPKIRSAGLPLEVVLIDYVVELCYSGEQMNS